VKPIYYFSKKDFAAILKFIFGLISKSKKKWDVANKT
jgi:hypothetical protein